MNKSQMSTTR
jgi:hypothetical protein